MINRLLGIIYIIMNKGTVTAKELAERFEVSVRTIYRDVDTLCMAGIPIYARKGKNGGISLTEQFVLNKLLITEKEQQEILAALLSVQETGAQEAQNTLQKLGEFFKTEPIDWLEIDLFDWSGTRQQLYEDIKRAILNHQVICFDYYGQSGAMSSRIVEPVQLLFKEYTWYVRGFCRERRDFRVFKVFRMKRVEVMEETFTPKAEVERKQEEPKNNPPDDNRTHIEMVIDKKEAYRIYDRFEENELEVLENGDFLVHMDCSLDDWVYGLILNFGSSATVLSPESVRTELQRRLQKMLENYK